ncbi:hypothetical protein V9T40_010194 [Parthenolecanium corni]|uniref:Uncharacterized protein n=1 Tax=Parthenolecanium corni TaxID=536013 RepID=A0AAN9XZY3_9HEMI
MTFEFKATKPKFRYPFIKMNNCNYPCSSVFKEVKCFGGNPSQQASNNQPEFYFNSSFVNGRNRNHAETRAEFANVSNQSSNENPYKSWARKPDTPLWVKSNAVIRLEPDADTEKLPKVCPRFLMENKTRWNKFTQEWEPVLNQFIPIKEQRYQRSMCPFHRGYQV